METLGGGSPNSVFFCSNFAFAIARPELINDEMFSNDYFSDEAVRDSVRALKVYKPNQAADLTLMSVEYSLNSRFPPYDRDKPVFTTLQILVRAMALNSVVEHAYVHVFKELRTEAGSILKVGASHGVAMKLVR